MESKLPKDPFILLSVANTKLRDFYSSLDIMCEDLDEDKSIILSELELVGYVYDEKINQFVRR